MLWNENQPESFETVRNRPVSSLSLMKQIDTMKASGVSEWGIWFTLSFSSPSRRYPPRAMSSALTCETREWREPNHGQKGYLCFESWIWITLRKPLPRKGRTITETWIWIQFLARRSVKFNLLVDGVDYNDRLFARAYDTIIERLRQYYAAGNIGISRRIRDCI